MSYITLARIGVSGNLGSQIQQYASLHAIAKETNKELIFPKSSLQDGFGLKFLHALDVPIKLVDDSEIANFKPIHPLDVVCDQSVFSLQEIESYNFTNLFHTHHYWYSKHNADVSSWTWNTESFKQAQYLYNSTLPSDKELVSLHVRRGDYLHPQHHHFCNLDVDYYSEALQDYIEDSKYHFVIFSNDIEWCKDNLIEGSRVTFVEPGIDYVDMILMSLCHHNIIANSSFSWWAAFFNKNEHKKVISPTNYIKQYSPFSFINNNFQLPNWKKIDNKA